MTRYKNKSDFSDTTIREVVEFCMPEGLRGIKVVYTSGRTKSKGWSYNLRKEIGIQVVKSNNTKYPYIRNDWKKEVQVLLLSRIEELVYITAHELRHQWQRKRPLKRLWVYGARDKRTKKSIERDAEAYGLRKVREWRKSKPKSDAIYLLPFLEITK